MRLRTLIAIGTIAAAISTPIGAPATPAAAYTVKTVERRDRDCPATSDRFACPHITFTYPVFAPLPDASAAAAINRAVNKFLLTSTGEPRTYASIEAEMDAFMQGYEEYRKGPGATSRYWEERTVTVRYLSDRIVSLDFEVSFFYGGLHPQYAKILASYNRATGAKIRLADILVPGFEPRLRRIAEKTFRAANGIAPGTSLGEAGYIFFPNDRFALNDNYSIGAEGLTFYYNPYEIAPYAMGPTTLLLPYRQIRDLIRPDGLLGSRR